MQSLTRGVMIGVVHDFENLTLTNFPTIFEPLELQLTCPSVLLSTRLLDIEIVELS